MNKYQIINACGEGFYGTVFKSRHKKSDTMVAIKQFKGKEDYATKREIETLLKLKHQNVINLREVFREQGKLHMVFEFLDTDLLNALDKYPKGMPERLVRIYMAQLCKALEYCHQRRVVHRDLKPENLLVTGDAQNPDPKRSLKLCDFGEARDIGPGDHFLSGIIGTRWYRAPEILIGAKTAPGANANDAGSFSKVTRPKLLRYDFQVDLWGAGCIMGELLLASPMFPADTDIQQLEMVQVYGTPAQIARRFNGKCSAVCLSGLKGLLDLSPHTRLTASTARQHQFFGGRGNKNKGGAAKQQQLTDSYPGTHHSAHRSKQPKLVVMDSLGEVDDDEILTESDNDGDSDGIPEDGYGDDSDDELGDYDDTIFAVEPPRGAVLEVPEDEDAGYSDDEFEEGYSDEEFEEPEEEPAVPVEASKATTPEPAPASEARAPEARAHAAEKKERKKPAGETKVPAAAASAAESKTAGKKVPKATKLKPAQASAKKDVGGVAQPGSNRSGSRGRRSSTKGGNRGGGTAASNGGKADTNKKAAPAKGAGAGKGAAAPGGGRPPKQQQQQKKKKENKAAATAAAAAITKNTVAQKPGSRSSSRGRVRASSRASQRSVASRRSTTSAASTKSGKSAATVGTKKVGKSGRAAVQRSATNKSRAQSAASAASNKKAAVPKARGTAKTKKPKSNNDNQQGGGGGGGGGAGATSHKKKTVGTKSKARAAARNDAPAAALSQKKKTKKSSLTDAKSGKAATGRTARAK